MNTKAIFDIAGVLAPWAKKKNIRFNFSITTNGSLLKPELVSKLVKIGLIGVRVTLDGEKELHNKRRPYLDGRGTFDAIIKNIGAVADKIMVEICANFDKENIKNLYKLLDYLDKQKLNRKIKDVCFAPVTARLGDNGNSGSAPSVEMVGCHTLAGELAKEALKLRREVIRRGYDVDRAAIVSNCPMEQDYTMIVVDPYGDIYKCAGFVGHKEFSVGHVSELSFNHRHAEFMAMNPWKECGDCVYVPMCAGGCRLMAQMKHGDCSKPFCDKEYYKKVFPELLKMDYERGAL